ncbi:MAG: ATP cone domain-containing protein [Candidatus Paceibacterota bacterium]
MPQKDIYVIKHSGEKQAFDFNKLKSSLQKSRIPEQTAEKVAEHIKKEVKNGMTTNEIYDSAYDFLHAIERTSAAKYSLRRSIFSLGPTGFPFEDLVGEIFKKKGYSIKNDVMIQGKCVSHEIDLVAWKENSVIVSEIKFHNKVGEKTDLKVALYVKARLDDLYKSTLHLDGKERHMDEGWLVTNTKFTTTAIQYGTCENIKLIGWSYPKEGNLQNLIEECGLHPLTCLTTLSFNEKRTLLEKGIVICKTLENNHEILRDLRLDDERIKEVLEEIKVLTT